MTNRLDSLATCGLCLTRRNGGRRSRGGMRWLDLMMAYVLGLVFRPDGFFYLYCGITLAAAAIIQFATKRPDRLIDLLFCGPALLLYSYFGAVKMLFTVAQHAQTVTLPAFAWVSFNTALFLVLWFVLAASIIGLHRRWAKDAKRPILRGLMLGVVANVFGLILVNFMGLTLARLGNV
jgi:hypothetical protein